MSDKKRQKVELDPAVDGIMTTSRYAQPDPGKRKKERDAARVRLRLDVPEWLKDQIEQVAGEHDTSMSQLAALWLAYALELYQAQDPGLLAAMGNAETTVRAMNWGHGYDLSDFAERLADSAKGV